MYSWTAFDFLCSSCQGRENLQLCFSLLLCMICWFKALNRILNCRCGEIPRVVGGRLSFESPLNRSRSWTAWIPSACDCALSGLTTGWMPCHSGDTDTVFLLQRQNTLLNRAEKVLCKGTGAVNSDWFLGGKRYLNVYFSRVYVISLLLIQLCIFKCF